MTTRTTNASRSVHAVRYYSSTQDANRIADQATTNDTPEAKNSQLQLSVIVPVYNQESQISNVLARIREIVGPVLQNSYELIVVDDGSTDNTLKYLKNEKNLDATLSVISYTQNRGKGYAVRQGVLHSSGDFVLFIDGDLEVSPTAIKDFLAEINHHDLVIASKRHRFSSVKSPLSRRFLSRAFNLLVRASVRSQFKDTQSGMKAGKGEMLRTIFKLMVVERFAFDVELLAIASLFNLSIKEMPITMDIKKRFKVYEIGRMVLDLAGVAYRVNLNNWYYKRIARLYTSTIKAEADARLNTHLIGSKIQCNKE